MDFGQVEVKKRDVGAEFQDLPERGGSIGTLRHHLKVAAMGAERHERLPQKRQRLRDE
jgi:hypothetical protein